MIKPILQTVARFFRTYAHIVVALLVLVGVLWYFGVGQTTAAWYSGGGGTWDKRVKITIQASQVDSTLTDFPVYVDLSDLPTDFHTNVRSDGGDIRITTADGETEIAREVVSIDTFANTGELHFKAPTLNASSDTEFYIYYGNGSAGDYTDSATYGTHNVWTSYEGVWHMGTSVLTDSTGKAGDSTTHTGTISSDAKLGSATDYGGSQQSIIPGHASISDDRVSDLYWWGWMEADAWGRQMEKSNQYFLLSFSGAGDSGPLIKPNNSTASVGTLSTGVYYQVGGRFTQTSGDDGVLDAILNGQVNNTTTGLPVISSVGNTDLYLGSDDSTTYMDGRMDEFRISGYKSNDWISAEYTNQNSPSTFYTVGLPTSEDTAPTISSVSDSPDPVAVGSDVTFSVDWSDSDSNGVKTYICKTDSVTPGTGCTADTWTENAASFSTTTPQESTYTTGSGDEGTQSYYAFACDSVGDCSSSVAGTFTVNRGQTNDIARSWYLDIGGNSVTDLTSAASFPDNPDGTDTLSSFEAVFWNDLSVTHDYADNYGQRVEGYIVPPETGNYTFWISSDNQSNLNLSTDEKSANKTTIANVAGYTGYREWNKEVSQQSSEIYLEAGTYYYVEALHKEGAGGDSLSVGWRKPSDGVGTIPSEIIPGSALSSTYAPPGPGGGGGVIEFRSGEIRGGVEFR